MTRKPLAAALLAGAALVLLSGCNPAAPAQAPADLTDRNPFQEAQINSPVTVLTWVDGADGRKVPCHFFRYGDSSTFSIAVDCDYDYLRPKLTAPK